MRILFFGDIVGRIGLEAVSETIDALVKKTGASLVIANGENASKGRGLTEKDYRALLDMGVDVVTLGNHYRDKDQIDDYINYAPFLIRPANLSKYDKGNGHITVDVGGVKVTVINLLCEAFMKEEVESPFETLNAIMQGNKSPITIVDCHGESTSEKAILAYGFDGVVSAVIGTHTHVQTSDERICPLGTAFISDAGMCGAFQSIIGFDAETTVRKMAYNEDLRLKVPEEGQRMVNAVLLDIDEETGMAKAIRRFNLVEGKER